MMSLSLHLEPSQLNQEPAFYGENTLWSFQTAYLLVLLGGFSGADVR